MVVHCLGHNFAPGVARCQDHDDKTAGAHVLHTMPKVCELLNGSSQSKERSLELCEEPMFRSAGIQAMKVAFSVKNIDVFSIDTGLNQCLDGRARALGVCNGADDPVRRIADEIARVV